MPWYLWVVAWLICGLITAYWYWRREGDDADQFLLIIAAGPIGLLIWSCVMEGDSVTDRGHSIIDGFLIDLFEGLTKSVDTDDGE